MCLYIRWTARHDCHECDVWQCYQLPLAEMDKNNLDECRRWIAVAADGCIAHLVITLDTALSAGHSQGGHHAHIGVPDTGGDINVNECQRRIWISSVTMMWHAVHIYFLLCKFAFYVNSPACLFPYSKQTTVMSDSGTVYLWGVLCCAGRGQQQDNKHQ